MEKGGVEKGEEWRKERIKGEGRGGTYTIIQLHLLSIEVMQLLQILLLLCFIMHKLTQLSINVFLMGREGRS